MMERTVSEVCSARGEFQRPFAYAHGYNVSVESPEPVATDRRHYNEKLRVLVVDDDRDTADTLAFILRDEGYVVSSVCRLRRALSYGGGDEKVVAGLVAITVMSPQSQLIL